mgnify:CR=1 FL=1
MAKFSIFLTEKSGAYLIPNETAANVFLQPQPDQNSSNLSSMSPDALSVVLTESATMPGCYMAEISNPYPRYDLYIEGIKQADFSGTKGFFFPSKGIYTKKGLSISSVSDVNPSQEQTGVGGLATPDGGGTWPIFDPDNLPTIFVLEPSELSNGLYVYRKISLIKNSIGVDVDGSLMFNLSLDPNGPTLAAYTCDIMIIMP